MLVEDVRILLKVVLNQYQPKHSLNISSNHSNSGTGLRSTDE